MFDCRMNSPVQFTARVPKSLKDKWLTRKTQIVPVETLAPVAARETFASTLFRTDLFVFTDSEVVEAALVKGYSSREDLCLLVSVFWDLVLIFLRGWARKNRGSPQQQQQQTSAIMEAPVAVEACQVVGEVAMST